MKRILLLLSMFLMLLGVSAQINGTYFLENQEGKFMARGADWGTRAIVDEWGLPVEISTDSEGVSTLKFVDTGKYLYNTSWNAYTDCGTIEEKSQWKLVLSDGKYRLSSLQQAGKYTKQDAGSPNIYTDGTGSNGTLIQWTLVTPEEHATEMANRKTSLQALSQSIEGLTSKTYVVCQPTRTEERYQQWDNDAKLGSIRITAPGIYHFSVQAFHRMASNDVTYPLHQLQAESPSVYAYFGDAKVQLKSVFDETVSGNTGFSYEGHNYPNGQGGALTAFQEGCYHNDIWLRIEGTGTYAYGIKYQGNPQNNAHWTCWAPDGIEVTRYYDPKTDGLDEEDQLIESLRYTIGDVNEDSDVTIADVTSLVNIILGKQSDYRMEISDVNEDGGVTIADVTSLVNIILGKQEAKVVDNTWTYANINATIYAEQSATENANGAGYAMNSAVCTLTDEDVRDKYTDIKEYLTTLNITTSLSNVESVSVYAKGKENIAGLMDYNTITKTATYSDGNTPSAYVNNDRDDVNGKNMQSDVVTVTGSNAGTYVAFLLPVALSNGVTVTVRDNNGKFYSQDFDVTEGVVNDLTFTETAATNNWMATIPGNVNFSMLSTPGAHNAATSSVSSTYADKTKCQSESIAELLANGVRAFDLRPQYKSSSTITADNLTIYHGSVSTGVKYKDAIATIASFLDEHPSEAISIIMTKEEGSGTDQTQTLVSVVTEIHNSYSSYFKVLDHSYYTLDDFRGKIFYACRPDWYVSSMTRVTGWPDDSSKTDYSVGVGGTCYASVEDAYNSTGDTKKSVVNAMLNLASANENRSRFHFTYTSVAWKLFGSSISTHANTQNPAAAQYISGTLTGPTGYVYADFMGSSSYSGQTLLKAVIEQNYKYVFKGRSRVEQQ